MNEIFKTLRDKFPFLSLIQKGDLEYVGIVQNQDSNVISFYDYGRLMMPQDKIKFLKCGEIWWHESNSCLLYTSPSPRDRYISRMPSSA